jgi:O-acetyl-ADP-ribose deacetylase
MTAEFLQGRLRVETGDITVRKADAIVNAANSSLMGGGGVDGAIHRAGGPEILDACRRLRSEHWREGLPPGEAAETTAGRLPAQWVIHTVGPIWRGGDAGEPKILARCYRSCLELAAGLGARSICFPAISTGVYGYPREKAARVAWDAISTPLGSCELPHTVTLVFFSEPDSRIFLQASGAA